MTAHIAFLITRGDAVGGATIHVRDMARTLIERGLQATVLIGGEGEAAEEIRGAGIPVVSISRLQGAIHPLQDALALRQVVGVLRELRPDLVSTHTAKAGIVGRVASRIAGIPALFTPHGWAVADRISPFSGKVFKLAERLAAPLASGIVNVCDAERSLAIEHGVAPAGKLVVVHNGVTDIAPTLYANPAKQPARIAMVARFESPKDHASLLKSLTDLADLAWDLELIGEGPGREQARALAQNLGIAERVHFCGSSPSVAERLSHCQMFALQRLSMNRDT